MDLGRTEAVHVDAGEVRLDVREQLFVPLELQMRMQAALHQDLVAPESDGLPNLLEEHVAIKHVGVGVVDFPVEGAEIADGRADIGVIDVAVDVVGSERPRMEPAAD